MNQYHNQIYHQKQINDMLMKKADENIKKYEKEIQENEHNFKTVTNNPKKEELIKSNSLIHKEPEQKKQEKKVRKQKTKNKSSIINQHTYESQEQRREAKIERRALKRKELEASQNKQSYNADSRTDECCSICVIT